MKKYKSATKMISARISEDNLSKLEDMSVNLKTSKNELLNQAVMEMFENFKINAMYRQAEDMGGNMTEWSREILRYGYVGKNLAVMRLHHT